MASETCVIPNCPNPRKVSRTGKELTMCEAHNREYWRRQKSFFRNVYPSSPGWVIYVKVKGKRIYGGLYYSDVIAAVFANDLLKQRTDALLNEIPLHIEQVARQVPARRGKHATKAEKREFEAHAAQVDRLYLEWLLQQQATQR